MLKNIKPILWILCLAITTNCTKHSNLLTVEISQRQLPVLTGKEANEILKMEVIKLSETNGKIEKFEISTSGTTDLNDIESASIFFTGESPVFSTDTLFDFTQNITSKLSFEGTQLLKYDTSYFWLSYKLKEKATLVNSVDAHVSNVVSVGGTVPVKVDSAAEKITQQLGVAVRTHNMDGVHTYRIPGLTTTTQGTLLACYDVRRDMRRDLQGNIDIGISRSTNGGQTWEPMRIALDMGKYFGLPEKFNGVSDACLLTDANTGNIYLAGLWMHGVINSEGKWLEGLTADSTAWNHQWRTKGSQPGFGIKQTSQFLITKSEDDGKTWSEPINITKMAKKKEWWLYAPAPGQGITLDDGTLVFPTQGRDKNGNSFSNITYSKDGGKTWTSSNPAFTNTTESAVVQLHDGSLMLNMRNNRNRNDKSDTNGRAVFITKDLGETWTEHPSSRGALIEPVCMASLHKHSYTENGVEKSVLLFSNPNSKYSRIKQTIKISFDEGMTWPEEYWLLLDEAPGRGGYSCISSIDENTIGILYESSQADMTFQKIPLERLISPE